MEYAAVAAGLALIAYGAVILRRPWDWYLANDAEPFDWWLKSTPELNAESVGAVSDIVPASRAARAYHQATQQQFDLQRQLLGLQNQQAMMSNDYHSQDARLYQNVNSLQQATIYTATHGINMQGNVFGFRLF